MNYMYVWIIHDEAEQSSWMQVTYLLLVIDAGYSRSNIARHGWGERSTWRKGECDQTFSTEGSLSLSVKMCLFSKTVWYLLSVRVPEETKVLVASKEWLWVPSRCKATHILNVDITRHWHDICRHTREWLVSQEILEKMWVISFRSLLFRFRLWCVFK